MDDTIRKSYWTVIPAEVRYCKKLGIATARDLYGEIAALCNEKGYCWATNKYFATLYGVEERTIQRWLTLLSKEKFVYTDNTTKRRKIFISEKLRATFSNDPVPDSGKENPAIKKVKSAKKKIEKQTSRKTIKNAKAKFTNDDLFLAELLLSKIIYNFPVFENKKVSIFGWADDIRLLRENEKATVDQISYMIHWVQGGELIREGKKKQTFNPHQFWAKNILSASKLRKQWFNLIPQLQEAAAKNIKSNSVGEL